MKAKYLVIVFAGLIIMGTLTSCNPVKTVSNIVQNNFSTTKCKDEDPEKCEEDKGPSKHTYKTVEEDERGNEVEKIKKIIINDDDDAKDIANQQEENK